jgi:GlpG protein
MEKKAEGGRMRQIGTLPGESARTFADYLMTLKIRTQLQPEGDGFAVWVCDEDHVPRARQELAEFTGNPTDARYRGVSSAAESLRRQEARVEEDYARRQRRMDQRMRGLGAAHRPLTLALVAISVVVALASNFGKEDDSPLLQALHISSYRHVELADGSPGIAWHDLSEIRSGQVWRLVTPIFIHYGPIHLIFNMLMMLSLGGAVESRRGSLRLLLMVLVLAAGSNFLQYHVNFEDGALRLRPSPMFGGMSGVLYGVFGYLWMKSRYEPQLGLGMSNETVLIMLGWFVLCLFGVIKGVANGAHAGGLILGLIIGVAPTVWRRLRGK